MEHDDRLGRFNDGRSAASRKVMVRARAEGLEIRGEDGFLIAAWRHADLRAGGEQPGAGGVRLCCAIEPDARLSLDDTVFARRLLSNGLPHSPRRFPWGMSAGFAGAALLLAAIYVALPGLARFAAGLVPVEMERGWGHQIASGMEQQMGRCRGSAGNAALTTLVARLAEALPADRRPVTVRVLNAGPVNALALPGTEIIVFRGLIDLTGDPDELAGVLAHELAHVAERHPSAALMRGLGVGVIATLITGDASGMVASAVAGLMASAYSRDDETAADRAAVETLRRAGIGNAGFATFFHRLEGKEAGGGMVPAWMSTHPESGARAAAIEAKADPRPLPPALRESEWQAVKGMCGAGP
jgi:predicted Zn-dependent protease